MPSAIETNLQKVDLQLPVPAASVANYVSYTMSGQLVLISGQLPFENGKLAATGLVGEDLSIEEGYHCAELCALNILSQLKLACNGDLDRIGRCLRLGGFVACNSSFTDHPKVVNGASDLIVKAMGDTGRHMRVAVGAPSLPLNAPVEVEGMFELKSV